MSDLREMAMHELNGDGALAHTRSHAFHRAMPYVTHRKHAGHTGFEQEWIPVRGPTSRALAVAHHLHSSQDKPTVIARHKAVEPIRAGLRPNKHEETARWYPIDSS